MILLRKFEVALVVTGNAENRAGAVIHQHEVRDVHRQAPFGIERVHHLERGPEALLLGGLDLGRAGPAGLALGDEVGRLGIAPPRRLRNRVIGGNGDEARPEDRVGPGREHLDLSIEPAGSARRKRNCRPRLLPIQFSCISRTLSGHWSSVFSPRAVHRRSR